MEENICYLTIDEFPSEDSMEKLNFLRKRNIPAILFARGDLLEQRPHIGVKAVRKGFVLGNHSYDHPDFSEISLRRARDQIDETDTIIDEIYRKAGEERKAKYFRFPYFNRGGTEKRTEELQEFLKDLGYRKPRFRDISYSWYREQGHHKFIDTYFTYSADIFRLFEKGNSIETVQDILEKMDRNRPEERMGLRSKKSNDIVLINDSPFEDQELSRKAFRKCLEKMLTMDLEFRLPHPHTNPFKPGPPTLEDFLS